ncbi:histidine phosphatase family protein [Sphingomonas sp. QA11]|uniref:histidine phosphatase family protein n=1 Tax=Sphingomonas sp. QA11 TaxID=2950605 RepID=UPI0023492ADD|nr:histidine phosphatase family protein [Sphingomonas sp. QA11]WCM25697.1 histidine phosphatase family protein [Sphingomonas sp. QA11]
MGLIVTIVRHGNTFDVGEAARRIGARTDLPLVASGLEQARALGAAFAGQGLSFDQALAAPLRRTQTTIEHILACQQQAPPVTSAGWLTEIDHGPDEGQVESCVVARIGHDALAAWDVEARAPNGWIVDADRRIEGWRALWETAHGHVLIVTSNGAARFALLSDEALRQQASALPSLKLRTGAYGKIAREQGGLRLVEWDRRP